MDRQTFEMKHNWSLLCCKVAGLHFTIHRSKFIILKWISSKCPLSILSSSLFHSPTLSLYFYISIFLSISIRFSPCFILSHENSNAPRRETTNPDSISIYTSTNKQASEIATIRYFCLYNALPIGMRKKAAIFVSDGMLIQIITVLHHIYTI